MPFPYNIPFCLEIPCPAKTLSIERAKAGEYDLIITREVSRFMRNLKLTLILIDELKEVGVEVYFVNDGIWTFNEEDYFKLHFEYFFVSLPQ